MSLQTPTIQQVNDSIIAQLEAALSQTIPLLPKAFNRVLAKVLAAVFIIVYKYAGFIFLQLFVKTASIRETIINGRVVKPLVEWGVLIGIGEPDEAVAARYVMRVQPLQTGGTLPAGTQVMNDANQVIYITEQDELVTGLFFNVDIVASSDPSGGGGAGSVGTLNVGDTVSFIDPLGYVKRDCTITGEYNPGIDAETEEAYRQRVTDRFAKLPQGGAYADYEQWGEGAAGIINIYPYTGLPGIVDVYAEADTTIDPDGIPTASQLQEVEDLIELDVLGLATRRPANSFTNVLPITRTEFTVTISGLTPNTTENQDFIEENVQAHFLTRAPFITGLSLPPKADTVSPSAVAGSAANAAESVGATFLTIVVEVGGSPLEIPYVLGEGEKAKGTVLFA